MQIWELIVKSNTFNFLILFFMFIFAYKFFNVSKIIEDAKAKIKEEIDKSDNLKEESIQKLDEAKTFVSNVEAEVKEIMGNGEKNIELMKEKINQDCLKEIENIKENSDKILKSTQKEIVSNLSQNAIIASFEVVKNHLIKTLKQKPEYHQKFINESIKEIDRLKS